MGDLTDGRKDDAGKPRFDLIPPEFDLAVARVLEYGARKYAPDNWRKVSDWKARYTAALMRHVCAWRAGEELDKESGLPHLAHAACCVAFLISLTGGAE